MKRSMLKNHGRHGYLGRRNSRGKRLLSKLGTLTPFSRLEEIFNKIKNEKTDQYEGEL